MYPSARKIGKEGGGGTEDLLVGDRGVGAGRGVARVKRDGWGSRKVTKLLEPGLDLGGVDRRDLVDGRVILNVDGGGRLSLDNGQGQDEYCEG
jgi:hypothetical protein